MQLVNWALKVLVGGALLALLTGCMTTGYHHAKDPNMVKKWDVTVISVEPQNIYNSVGVALVGPLASVDSKGWKVSFIADGEKAKTEIVQPSTDRYELHPGQKAIYIVSRGSVWVQPTDYPLPPEFFTAPVAAAKPQIEQPKNITPTQPEKQPVGSVTSNTAPRDESTRLSKLKALKEHGDITQEEYEKKKREILDSL